ncbi:hypothetical protein [Tunicatimonas pelagia]|uniref:hypothetical protein n=1 Tax=Tunicatimonas pelagia TaxID=931531 RepID=UPI002666310D|nr:hypothetical protein [Tunicatimonas pelagia]WKN43050.1 hypothetical protein P0M28_28840 [Tunicatimonas pelagia]
MQQPTLKSALLIIFTVFLLLLQYPLISIANQRATVLDIPQLYLYIFGTWVLMTVLLGILLENNRLKP